VAAVLGPDRAFGPLEPLREDLDLRVLGDEFVELRVLAVDAAEGGGLLVVGAEGREEGDRERDRGEEPCGRWGDAPGAAACFPEPEGETAGALAMLPRPLAGTSGFRGN
jgi:hypothetical protein